MAAELVVAETIIPGFFEVDLVVHTDSRGWFKENYQKAKLEALGLPAFEVIQNNFSFNSQKGVARGLHAEPWEKFISVANGKVFGAWVDLRAGPAFGKVLTIEITPEKAVFVPRGVANAYQTLDDNIVYTYLVNQHWSPEAKYTYLNMQDPQLAINWPIPITDGLISDKDKAHPFLRDISPIGA